MSVSVHDVLSGVMHGWTAGTRQPALGHSWLKLCVLPSLAFEARTKPSTHLLPATASPACNAVAERLSSKILACGVQSQAVRQWMAAYHRVLGNKVYLKTLSEKCVPNKG